MTKFKGKYRVESSRLPEWNYASPGWYFVTICVKNREAVFGQIRDGVMHLSPLGKIAHQFLADIPRHFPHTEMDAFVVMPNHVHAIVVILDDTVEMQHVAFQQQPKKGFGPLQPGSLSKIIQAYKAAVTRWARNDGYIDFAWQERFYDHIIRDDRSLEHIRKYVVGNPVKWQADENYSGM